jgi:hypothetical protein
MVRRHRAIGQTIVRQQILSAATTFVWAGLEADRFRYSNGSRV